MMRQRNPNDPRYKIDITKKVFVYKNLHKDCWSIKQGGLVKVHATELNLWMCDFKVNQKGREKVLREKEKECSRRSSWLHERVHMGYLP